MCNSTRIASIFVCFSIVSLSAALRYSLCIISALAFSFATQAQRATALWCCGRQRLIAFDCKNVCASMAAKNAVFNSFSARAEEKSRTSELSSSGSGRPSRICECKSQVPLSIYTRLSNSNVSTLVQPQSRSVRASPSEHSSSRENKYAYAETFKYLTHF